MDVARSWMQLVCNNNETRKTSVSNFGTRHPKPLNYDGQLLVNRSTQAYYIILGGILGVHCMHWIPLGSIGIILDNIGIHWDILGTRMHKALQLHRCLQVAVRSKGFTLTQPLGHA